MSSLANSMGALLGRTKKSIFDIADSSRIDVNQIHRWRCGQEHFITPRELVRVARAFSPKNRELVETHALLLHGHLKDLCMGPGSKLICLEVTSSPHWLITSSFGISNISPGVERELRVIHNHVWRNQRVRAMVRSIAKYCKQEGLA